MPTKLYKIEGSSRKLTSTYYADDAVQAEDRVRKLLEKRCFVVVSVKTPDGSYEPMKRKKVL